MKLTSLNNLLIHELRDLYSAERQLTKALPKLAKAVSSTSLRRALEEHLSVTETQIERLEEIFQQLEASSRGPKCEAMEGLIKEGESLLEEKDTADAAVLDAALIAAAQRVEHYEMAGYGCARTFARLLGYEEIADQLQESLDEEGEADKLLTELAESEVNAEAIVGEEEEED